MSGKVVASSEVTAAMLNEAMERGIAHRDAQWLAALVEEYRAYRGGVVKSIVQSIANRMKLTDQFAARLRARAEEKP